MNDIVTLSYLYQSLLQRLKLIFIVYILSVPRSTIAPKCQMHINLVQGIHI